MRSRSLEVENPGDSGGIRGALAGGEQKHSNETQVTLAAHRQGLDLSDGPAPTLEDPNGGLKRS